MGANKNTFNDLREREVTVNMTFKIKGLYLNSFENEMLNSRHINLISFKTLPDTDELYEKSEGFRQIIKKEKALKREKDDFINKYGHKWRD